MMWFFLKLMSFPWSCLLKENWACTWCILVVCMGPYTLWCVEFVSFAVWAIIEELRPPPQRRPDVDPMCTPCRGFLVVCVTSYFGIWVLVSDMISVLLTTMAKKLFRIILSILSKHEGSMVTWNFVPIHIFYIQMHVLLAAVLMYNQNEDRPPLPSVSSPAPVSTISSVPKQWRGGHKFEVGRLLLSMYSCLSFS